MNLKIKFFHLETFYQQESINTKISNITTTTTTKENKKASYNTAMKRVQTEKYTGAFYLMKCFLYFRCNHETAK